jgi:hypothetical protein
MVLRRKIFSILLGIFFMTSISCASTQLASQRDSTIPPNSYSAIVVEALFRDVGVRQECEKAVQNSLEKKGYICFKASDLFFIGRNYTQSEISKIFAANEIEALLVVKPTGSGCTSTYMPKTEYTEGSASIYGNRVSGSSTTKTYGGYNVYKPWASFEMSIVDIASGETIWYATASSGGNAFASNTTLIRSASGKLAEQIHRDKLLKKAEQK